MNGVGSQTTDVMLIEMNGVNLAVPLHEVVTVQVVFDMVTSAYQDQKCHLDLGIVEHESKRYKVYSLQRDFSFNIEKKEQDRFVICLSTSDSHQFFALLAEQAEHHNLKNSNEVQFLSPLMKMHDTPVKGIFSRGEVQQGENLVFLSNTQAIHGFIQHKESGDG